MTIHLFKLLMFLSDMGASFVVVGRGLLEAMERGKEDEKQRDAGISNKIVCTLMNDKLTNMLHRLHIPVQSLYKSVCQIISSVCLYVSLQENMPEIFKFSNAYIYKHNMPENMPENMPKNCVQKASIFCVNPYLANYM